MAITPDQVRHVAHLARLDLDDVELHHYSESLSRILDLVNQMDAVDTSGITPMAHPQDAPLRLRPDRVTEENERERFQAVAPAVDNGLYLVPKVVE